MLERVRRGGFADNGGRYVEHRRFEGWEEACVGVLGKADRELYGYPFRRWCGIALKRRGIAGRLLGRRQAFFELSCAGYK